MVKVTIKFNRDSITSAIVAVQGVSGESCMLLTPEIMRLNKDATITPTEEYNEAVEKPVKLYDV